MNINWLKKTEKKLGESDSRFCGCFDKMVSRAIDLVYSGKPTNEVDFSTLPSGYCHQCDLPVDGEKIQSINSQIDLILPMYSPVESGEIEEMPVEAARTVQLDGSVPSGMISRSEVAARLGIKPDDVERHIRSGRLILDVSKKFITQQSFDELKMLLIRRTNG